MHWFNLVLTGWCILNVLVCIFNIGKETKPMKPGTAVIMVIIYGLFIGGIILYR